MDDVSNIYGIRYRFRCTTEWYLFDQNNGCQNEMNEKINTSAVGISFELPIGVCLYEYPDRLFVSNRNIANLEKSVY